MADLCPRSLDEYCKIYQINFFDLRMLCIFCKFPTSLQDLASFHTKRLSIVWRDNTPHACCMKCIRLSAIVEKEQYCMCIVNCCFLDALVGKPLKDISMRCVQCYSLLDYAEKLDACASEREVYLIRGYWRTDCRDCVQKE
uniref:Protein E6 n=1 Tax=Human papillomavirus TaxID=10566 RepID=A0A385PPD1_9PAPI|nr:MAG: E6 protein [Human papillomavirus]